tara:strand:+ start:203 stop:586 length:384 start_codon:yes stop_codon:yes gene_type:complete
MLGFLERNNWIAWVLVFAIGGFIFYVSSLTYDETPGIVFPFRAVVYHLGVFFLFTFFLMVASSRGKDLNWVFFSVIFALFYGVLDELHQLFVNGRGASLGDVFLDGIGIVFAFLSYVILVEFRKVKF